MSTPTFDPAGPPPPKPTGQPTQDERTWGLIAHLSGILAGFLGPLIIWLVKKDESPFVSDQAKEALNFQIAVLIAFMIAGALTLVIVGFFLVPLVAIGNLVFCILAGMEANKGVAYRYPYTIRLIN